MSRKEKGKSVKLEDAIQAAQDEKRVTVTVTTTEKSEFIWNDGENEPKTFESYEELRPAVEELLEEYDVVRFIFDNRAGIPFDTVQKAFIELEDARLANYIY